MAFGFRFFCVQVWWLVGVCCLSGIAPQTETSLHMYVLSKPLLEAYLNYLRVVFFFSFLFPLLSFHLFASRYLKPPKKSFYVPR